ncbi:MAG: EAL domain-containing protein, partial [Pseudomonadota bacterium]
LDFFARVEAGTAADRSRASAERIAAAEDPRGFRPPLSSIAERFDMMTVAEHVEKTAEARVLTEMGISFFQGFQFGSPSLLLKPTTSPMPDVAAQA